MELTFSNHVSTESLYGTKFFLLDLAVFADDSANAFMTRPNVVSDLK